MNYIHDVVNPASVVVIYSVMVFVGSHLSQLQYESNSVCLCQIKLERIMLGISVK